MTPPIAWLIVILCWSSVPAMIWLGRFTTRNINRMYVHLIERNEAELELIEHMKLLVEDLASRDPQLEEHMELLQSSLAGWARDCHQEIKRANIGLKVGFGKDTKS